MPIAATDSAGAPAPDSGSRLSLLTLIAANLLPLAGVFWFDWDARVVVLLYWAENLVIGFYNILKLAAARGEDPKHGVPTLPAKLFIIAFFCLHFGGFCAGHGFFLLSMFKIGDSQAAFSAIGDHFGPLVFLHLLFAVIATLWESRPPGMGWALLALLVSHGVSFVQNYLGRREYERLSLQQIMMRPYGRIIVMHIAVLAGGFLVMRFGSPVGLLAVLIVLKTGLDILLHSHSHRVGSDAAVTSPNQPVAEK